MHDDYDYDDGYLVYPDPGPLPVRKLEDLYVVEIFSFTEGRKIAAIKFIRSVTAARNKGESLGLKEAKKAVDKLESGEVPKLVIAGVPTHLRGLVNQAARDSLVNINGPAGDPLYL